MIGSVNLPVNFIGRPGSAPWPSARAAIMMLAVEGLKGGRRAAVIAALAGAAIAGAAAPRPPAPNVGADLDGFTPLRQIVREPDGPDPAATRRARAVWPVANGRIFTYAGYGPEANRLFMITGPRYQTRRNHEPHGAFGQSWLELLVGSAPPRSLEREWREVPRAAAVVTREDFAGGWRIETLDVAHASLPVVLRRVTVTAGGGAGRIRIRTDALPDGPAVVDGLSLVKTYRSDPPRTLRIVVLEPGPGAVRLPVTATEDALEVVVGQTTPVSFTVALAASDSAAAEVQLLEALKSRAAGDLVREGLAAWRAQLDGTITASPDGPIRQHLEAAKRIVLAQRSLPHGGVSPMVSFKGVWARDSNGPLKAFLWMGWPDLARDLLVYYRKASALRGATRREYPLDLPVETAPELDAAAWSRTGTDRCEVPSWIVLQHAWYYDAAGDAGLVRDAWPYLERNAFHQETFDGPHGPLQRFNGDETYFHGAFYALFPQRGVWPNEFPRASAYSFDSLVVREQALRALARLAPAGGAAAATAVRAIELADRTQASLDAHFWMEEAGAWAPALSPVTYEPHRALFAPVNLRPLWLNPLAASSERERRNLDAVIAQLGRADGLVHSTPSVSQFIGSLPGEWLAALAAVDHPLAWRALPGVLRAASPSGEFVEVHEADGPGHSYDATWPNRLRPWETGLVMDGILRFLTGATFEGGRAVSFRPRRPDRLALSRLGPIPLGDTRLELRYPAADDPRGDDAPAVVVHLSGPACLVNGVRLEPGASHPVPLVRPRSVSVPAPRAFESALSLPAGTRLMITTALPEDRRPGDVLLDAGLPFRPADLAAVLFDGAGARRYETVVFEAPALRADRETMKPEGFWRDAVLAEALSRFERAGGTVLRRR